MTKTHSDVASKDGLRLTARVGLTARGIVYILLGLLAMLVSQGSAVDVDQKSALAQLLVRPYGFLMVAAMALGFAAYAVWRLTEAVMEFPHRGLAASIESLVRALAYLALCVLAISLLTGSRESQASQQQDLAARTMTMQGGQWIVAAFGLAILLIGAYMIWQGTTRRFMRYFPGGATSRKVRGLIKALGWIGNVARGFVFLVMGGLVALAGWEYSPGQATGIDGAVNSIMSWPSGDLLVGGLGLGLIMFGIYGLLEARYRRI